VTEDSVRRFSSVWPIWAWIMVAFGLIAAAVAILGGVFPRSLVLDLISFWPGLILVLLVAAALYPFHRGNWSRLAAVVPLLVLSWLGSTIALHLAEWSVLPSAAADFAGPPAVGIDEVALTAITQGEMTTSFSDIPFLYDVKTIRKGGSTPPARGLERLDGGPAQITIDEREPDTWFLTTGWRIRLSRDTVWSVDLEAGDMTVDLSGGRISALRLAGAGDVVLPVPTSEVLVIVEGRFELSLPDGTAMSVVGADVTVPGDWAGSGDEWVSPATGDGYIVTVTSGASLVVRDA